MAMERKYAPATMKPIMLIVRTAPRPALRIVSQVSVP